MIIRVRPTILFFYLRVLIYHEGSVRNLSFGNILIFDCIINGNLTDVEMDQISFYIGFSNSLIGVRFEIQFVAISWLRKKRRKFYWFWIWKKYRRVLYSRFEVPSEKYALIIYRCFGWSPPRHIFGHVFSLFTYHLPHFYSDSLSDIYSDSLSGILSDIFSDSLFIYLVYILTFFLVVEAR